MDLEIDNSSKTVNRSSDHNIDTVAVTADHNTDKVVLTADHNVDAVAITGCHNVDTVAITGGHNVDTLAVTGDHNTDRPTGAVTGDHNGERADLSHVEFKDHINHQLNTLISQDPLLVDLPQPLTVEEVESQISVELGQSITVMLRKLDGEILPIVVPAQSSCTVRQFKRCMERQMYLRLSRHMSDRSSRHSSDSLHISWRHVWKSHHLISNGRKLTEDSADIRDYGISNKSEVTFIPRLRVKHPVTSHVT